MNYTYEHHRELEPVPGSDRIENGKYVADLRVDARGGRTVCIITDDDGNELARGEARCHPDDNYVKWIGRWYSRLRAEKALVDKRNREALRARVTPDYSQLLSAVGFASATEGPSAPHTAFRTAD